MDSIFIVMGQDDWCESEIIRLFESKEDAADLVEKCVKYEKTWTQCDLSTDDGVERFDAWYESHPAGASYAYLDNYFLREFPVTKKVTTT